MVHEPIALLRNRFADRPARALVHEIQSCISVGGAQERKRGHFFRSSIVFQRCARLQCDVCNRIRLVNRKNLIIGHGIVRIVDQFGSAVNNHGAVGST